MDGGKTGSDRSQANRGLQFRPARGSPPHAATERKPRTPHSEDPSPGRGPLPGPPATNHPAEAGDWSPAPRTTAKEGRRERPPSPPPAPHVALLPGGGGGGTQRSRREPTVYPESKRENLRRHPAALHTLQRLVAPPGPHPGKLPSPPLPSPSLSVLAKSPPPHLWLLFPLGCPRAYKDSPPSASTSFPVSPGVPQGAWRKEASSGGNRSSGRILRLRRKHLGLPAPYPGVPTSS